jgi:hypothetical protein
LDKKDKELNMWIYVLLILGSVAISGSFLISDAYAWTLTVKLIEKPFGDDKAWVEVKGPDGFEEGYWYDWGDIKTGPSTATVNIEMSESSFPSGEQYQVCVSSKTLFNLIPNCARITHGSGDEIVRMSLE